MSRIEQKEKIGGPPATSKWWWTLVTGSFDWIISIAQEVAGCLRGQPSFVAVWVTELPEVFPSVQLNSRRSKTYFNHCTISFGWSQRPSGKIASGKKCARGDIVHFRGHFVLVHDSSGSLWVEGNLDLSKEENPSPGSVDAQCSIANLVSEIPFEENIVVHPSG